MPCLFHFLFKAMAIVFYIFFGLFSSDKTLCYIIVITLSALDFWTVKNVTGRLLVGLRWWSRVKDDGKEEWIFESLDQRNLNKIDTRVFWTSQYLMGGIWVVFAVVSVLTINISNLTVCVIGAVLSITNTLGYIKCDKNHQNKMGSYLMNKAKNNLSSDQMIRIGMYGMGNRGAS
uniref:Golgi apparatus membrane protein TVP23 homolog n=1 Tax=Strombidium rassoulzadegani TaxID=1082188 RepID=A0A7S3CSL4_9SPIT|mmetsp:Transcript_3713/g.6334  ORF Transcript_3713/g.6334 Transcript_3713/m.6334 type:complete len:175 (+) Transcript_3713:253-777(+)